MMFFLLYSHGKIRPRMGTYSRNAKTRHLQHIHKSIFTYRDYPYM